jgi:acyl carrier protein
MPETLNELLKLIHEAYDIDPSTIDPDKPLADYGLDSLSKAELLFAIEDKFHIQYPDAESGVETLTALASVVTRLRSASFA